MIEISDHNHNDGTDIDLDHKVRYCKVDLQTYHISKILLTAQEWSALTYCPSHDLCT
jgi:hypothetical protein